MSIYEFKSRLNLIKGFIIKMNKATVPEDTKRIIVKIYANNLKLNLTNRMIDEIM